MVRQSCEVESNIVSVERIKEYVDLKPEAPLILESNRPPASWPDRGAIEFHKYSTRYRAGLDLVLRDLSFSIKSGEKIGIVGRTGAGKSSMVLSLFRLVEPVSGTILIDGIDITL
jgi:ATP-binding cassette subfamily C (CFTR/MRP) protein 1